MYDIYKLMVAVFLMGSIIDEFYYMTKYHKENWYVGLIKNDLVSIALYTMLLGLILMVF